MDAYEKIREAQRLLREANSEIHAMVQPLYKANKMWLGRRAVTITGRYPKGLMTGRLSILCDSAFNGGSIEAILQDIAPIFEKNYTRDEINYSY